MRSAFAGGFARVWAYARTAPWTFSWLAVLVVTTIVQHAVSRDTRIALLGERSTNLRHLQSDPVHVLVTSLLWIDGYFLLPYVLLFCVFHVPAERWLGSLRWAVIGLSAHVAATYIGEGVLALAIRHGAASAESVDVRDIGVSYFLAAIVGVLTYHIAVPWRWAYLTAIVVCVGLPLVVHPTFTAVGHFSSMLIGLAWYPLTRGRDYPQWDPALARARRRHRRRGDAGER
jgi:hypothetical protein